MTVRVRFAPSPTGKVHIGNLRAAIFNYLFARHCGGQFLLRVEDTDRERSTQEAIDVLLDAMTWVGLDWDESPVYQSTCLPAHQAAAKQLLESDNAYMAPPRLSLWSGLAEADQASLPQEIQDFLTRLRQEEGELRQAHQAAFLVANEKRSKKKKRRYLEPLFFNQPEGPAGEPALHFRLPFKVEDCPQVKETEEIRTLEVHSGWPVLVSGDGIEFLPAARVKEEVPRESYIFELESRSLCGFQGLEILAEDGECLFRLAEQQEEIDAGRVLVVPGGKALRFRRRYVEYNDIVKGVLSKPLEGLKNRVLVRSNGMPVFHLANVVDDHDMGITHIVRGDDHVENTYWHILLFMALGWAPPSYGHLPMIVNDKGRPLSKRDGDVYVGEYRNKGILPVALFNYLALLGWSPGEDREKVARPEMVELFSLERVITTSARFDMEKMLWLNGQYMLEQPVAELAELAQPFLKEAGLVTEDRAWVEEVVALLQDRVRSLADIPAATAFFFAPGVTPDMGDKKVRKTLSGEGVTDLLQELGQVLSTVEPFAGEPIEEALRGFAQKRELGMGKVSQPLRVAVTGGVVSPPIGGTLALIGRERVLTRIAELVTFLATEGETK